MKTLNPYPLDLDAFRHWLHTAQRPGDIAGITTDDTACPLSNFLQDTYGGGWAVHFSEFEPLVDGLLQKTPARFALPAWATCFAFRLDLVAGCQHVPVSFVRALVLLDDICAYIQKAEAVHHG